MLADLGHLFDPAATRRANRRLDRVLTELGPIGPSNQAMTVQHAHFANGPFPAGHTVRQHQHEELQIEATISGRFVFVTRFGSYPLELGQCCVVRPRWPHAWHCTHRGVLLGLLLSDRSSKPSHTPWQPMGREDREDRDGRDGLHRVNLEHERALLAEIVEACLAQGDGWALDRTRGALLLWLNRLLGSLAQAMEGESSNRESLPTVHPNVAAWGRAATRRAAAFMRANLDEPIALADVASEAGLSERHLRRLFRQHEGVSVQGYLTELRLQEARSRLRASPDEPLKAIAVACGFRQPGYFSRCYRRCFGLTPSADRPAPDDVT